MGSFDGAEICELVGLFILEKLSEEFRKYRMWVYSKMMDQARKQLHRLFEPLKLKITIDVCHQAGNLLDVTLNLTNGSYQPYRKPNNDPLYINSNSNHSPSIIKQLPISINERHSHLSSNRQSFELCATMYENALNRSNYQ